MQIDEKMLQAISDEAKKRIREVDIVTPSIYTSIFSDIALANDYDISDEKSITDNLLKSKLSLLENMQNETSKNAQVLSENTDKAISAIRDKDEKALEEVSKEAQDLKKEIKKLKDSMYIDELTKVYNRKWLHDNILDREGLDFKDSGTLAMIDLNYFKEINDTYGHTIGDKVLVFIASQLKKTKEKVIRYGGDEFLVIFCDDVKEKVAISKINSIRDDILHKHMKVKDSSFKVSFAFGTQEFKNTDRLMDIVEKADKKMYDDKTQIKKRVPGI